MTLTQPLPSTKKTTTPWIKPPAVMSPASASPPLLVTHTNPSCKAPAAKLSLPPDVPSTPPLLLLLLLALLLHLPPPPPPLPLGRWSIDCYDRRAIGL